MITSPKDSFVGDFVLSVHDPISEGISKRMSGVVAEKFRIFLHPFTLVWVASWQECHVDDFACLRTIQTSIDPFYIFFSVKTTIKQLSP
jgi:hypothetical protein